MISFVAKKSKDRIGHSILQMHVKMPCWPGHSEDQNLHNLFRVLEECATGTGYIRVKKSLSDESVIIFWEISSYHWDKVFKTLEISGAHEISGAREVSEFHNDYQLKW